jgi:hypothetical protein
MLQLRGGNQHVKRLGRDTAREELRLPSADHFVEEKAAGREMLQKIAELILKSAVRLKIPGYEHHLWVFFC